MKLQIGIIGVIWFFLSYGCNGGAFQNDTPSHDKCKDSSKEGCAVVDPQPQPSEPIVIPGKIKDKVQLCLFYTFDDAGEKDLECHHCDKAELNVEINGETGSFDLSNKSSRKVQGIKSGKEYTVFSENINSHYVSGKTYDNKHYVSDIPGGIIEVVTSADNIALKASYKSNPRCLSVGPWSSKPANKVLFSLIVKSGSIYYATSKIQSIPLGKDGINISKRDLRSSTTGYEFDDWCKVIEK